MDYSKGNLDRTGKVREGPMNGNKVEPTEQEVELRRSLEAERAKVSQRNSVIVEKGEANMALHLRVTALENALSEYGRCKWDCASYNPWVEQPCDCGFKALLGEKRS